MARLYIIDDDGMTALALTRLVEKMGHEVGHSPTIADGMQALRQAPPDLVLLDVNLPDGNGLEVLPEIKALPSAPEVLIITAIGDADGAELAVTSGAWDYVQKPLSASDLRLSLRRALRYRETKRNRSRAVSLRREGVVGESPALLRCLDLVAEAGDSDVPVLVHGETGTGKELIARAIHQNSRRFARSFVTVDCAALPPTLVESVLFGHRKGAFTGADRDRDGLVAQADRGTLFLDEVGEMPMEAQRVFLRVLQEKRFRPVGGTREYESDFRIVAATNRDVERLVDEGRFRADLMFRLRGFSIELPPLRDRLEDLRPLVLHAMLAFCEAEGLSPKRVSNEYLRPLARHDWPGNVRELLQVVQQSLVSARDEAVLLPVHLPTDIRAKAARSTMGAGAGDGSAAPAAPGLPPFKEYRRVRVDRVEREYLVSLIAACGGSPAEARRVSGLSKTRLYELLAKHGLTLT